MVHHWLWLDDEEIGNATRTNAYIRRYHPTVVLDDMCESCGSCDAPPDSRANPASLAVAGGVITWEPESPITAQKAAGGVLLLSEEDFASPAMDPAPWYSAILEESKSFYGFLTTRVQGLADSTRSATVTESLNDGGTITGFRRGTREVRVTGVLVGRDVAALEAGMSWLDSRLEAGREDGCREGVTLRWYQSCPTAAEGATAVTRELRDCRVVAGPTVLDEKHGTDIVVRSVEFTVVAERPWIHGPEVPQVVFTGGQHEVRRTGVTVADVTWERGVCVEPTWPIEPIIDPRNPLPPAPPFDTTPGETIARDFSKHMYVELPAGMAAPWADGSLRIVLQPRANEAVRDVRVRVVESVSPTASVTTTDMCDETGEFIVDYIPAGHYVNIDTGRQRISAGKITEYAATRAASHLVKSSVKGRYFEYPKIKGERRHFIYIDSSVPVGVSVYVSARFS